MTQEIFWLILIGIFALIVVWLITREIGTAPKLYGLQKEVNMRLTYKRYMELYPDTNITYEQYKKMQAQHAYRKAVSSTKIKRMVR
jgi:hypothetical protein